MKILKRTMTAFERQILENVMIQKSRENYIMNNMAEYNRFALPRLTAKLGEKDLERWRTEDREEMQREATIEEKIRIRKKEKAKKRGETNRRMEQGQPRKKKLRLEEGLETAEEQKKTENELSIATSPAEESRKSRREAIKEDKGEL